MSGIIVGGIVGIVTAIIGIPMALTAAGFSAAGVVAGSIAAAIYSVFYRLRGSWKHIRHPTKCRSGWYIVADYWCDHKHRSRDWLDIWMKDRDRERNGQTRDLNWLVMIKNYCIIPIL